MDILFVLPEFPPEHGGGIATYYKTLIPAAASEGHSIDVLVGSAYTNAHERREEETYSVEFLDVELRGQTIEEFAAYEVVRPLRRTLAAAWALFRQAEGGTGYDLIETTDFGLLYLPWVTSENSPPVQVQLHGSNGQIDAREPKEGGALQGHMVRLLEMQGLSQADALQSHARTNVERWQKRLDREVGYCPPPLPPQPLSERASAALDLEAAGFVAGRIQYWKGPTVLCEAQVRLGAQAPRIEWAGRDTDYQAVGTSMSDYLAETYPTVWGKSIRPIGSVSPEEVARRQRAARFVLVPSIWDVFNYTAVEALREGTVVICSDGAGACDVIEHGRSGFLFPATNEKRLAEAIYHVRSLSDGKREKIGQAGREAVQNVLSPQRIARDRYQKYKHVVRDGDDSSTDTLWLTEAVRPGGEFEVEGKPLAVLNQLPLRDLTNYLLRRIWGKVVSL
jgi:glycosyltransferase involved in cell wall biosynthesis